MEWYVRKATLEDIPYLAENLREADKKEIHASSGRTPQDSLNDAFTHPSEGIWVGVYQGNPEIIFGLTRTDDPKIAVPWMVCTDKLKESPKEFINKCKRWVQGFSRQFSLLINFVYAENELHIRWLKWCGFSFVKLHENYGHTQEPFWEFQMKREV